MHHLEPYYSWRDLYSVDEDSRSPFYGKEYSEFFFSEKIYNFYIHPQWDNIGSPTLFLKIIFADYDEGVAIIELIGEWNDCLHNDIMTLKRELIDLLIADGIYKFILIGENVLNFHSSDDCYYEEWSDELIDNDGWIALLNFREHVIREFVDAEIDSYFVLGGDLEELNWRNFHPLQFYKKIDRYVQRRLSPSVQTA